MEGLSRSGSRVWNRVAGNRAPGKMTLRRGYEYAKRRAKQTTIIRRYRTVKSKFRKTYAGNNFAMCWAGQRRANHIGVYSSGSCELASVVACIPSIKRVLNGTCCIINEWAADLRSDVLLQRLQDLPEEQIGPVIEKLHLSAGSFQSRLFEESFTVSGPNGVEEFPKKVVVLSIAVEVARTVYRHREHGLLVDPGGWWLAHSVDSVLANLSTVTWFQENFESVGKLSSEQFTNDFAEVVRLVKQKTGASVMVFNMPCIDPGSQIHNYQFVKDPQNMRRIEFNLALVELSRKLDFPIVDVDRIIKRTGISEAQVDFGHFPPEAYGPVSKEVFGILQDLKVF